MMINKDEIVEGLFQSPLFRHQIGLETSMKGSGFIFDCVHLLYNECYKIIFKCDHIKILLIG